VSTLDGVFVTTCPGSNNIGTENKLKWCNGKEDWQNESRTRDEMSWSRDEMNWSICTRRGFVERNWNGRRSTCSRQNCDGSTSAELHTARRIAKEARRQNCTYHSGKQPDSEWTVSKQPALDNLQQTELRQNCYKSRIAQI
jgi:hypothetical protein